MWPGKQKDILIHLLGMYADFKNKEVEKDTSVMLRLCSSETAGLETLSNPAVQQTGA